MLPIARGSHYAATHSKDAGVPQAGIDTETPCQALVHLSRNRKHRKDDRNTRGRRAARILLPRTKPMPSSDVQRREAGLVKVVDTFTLDLTPLIFLPQRLGRSLVLDTATDALVQFPVELALDTAQSIRRRDAFKSYSKALRLVHDTLEQLEKPEMQTCETFENLVGAIMILSFVDIISIHVGWDKGTFGSFTHWNGVTSILLSSPPAFAGSDIARSCVDHGGLCNYIIPVFLGRPSPFENPAWLEAQPAILHSQSSELAKLNHISHQLLIRLPRLICRIRELRLTPETSVYAETAKLADEVLQLRNDASESWLLHQVNVKDTSYLDSRHRKLAPYSFVFRSCAEMEAGLSYWHGRLLILLLSSLLAKLKSIATGKHETERAELKEEKLRTINNILMCWQYGKASGFAATAQFNLPLVAVWAAVRDLDKYRGGDVDEVAEWILATHRQCYCGWIIGSLRADLDAAADVVTGGTLDGPLVRLMQLSVLNPQDKHEVADRG